MKNRFFLRTTQHGFTLIELSIVLVIIALLSAGILVGRDLIASAVVRAQIGQIEKYNTATNTFKAKYGYLPGDIPDPTASQFGFTPRGTCPGTGDGNGLIQGTQDVCPNSGAEGIILFTGEPAQFWIDLSQAKLVDGGFSAANMTTIVLPWNYVTPDLVPNYFPRAKIGVGYVYAWSGGWKNWYGYAPGDSLNYFAVSGFLGGSAWGYTYMDMTVAQAYAIDSKLDDGLPQTGRVMAIVPGFRGWSAGGALTDFGEMNTGDFSLVTGGPITSAADIGSMMPAGPDSCYDGASGLPEKYSMNQNGGRGLNCALSFRFQ